MEVSSLICGLIQSDTTKLTPMETLVTVAMGIVGVFVILLVLIFLLWCFQLIFKFNLLDKIFKKKKQAEAPAMPNAFESSEDEETIAAIMAAVSCVLAEESQTNMTPPFKIKSIQRIK